MSEADKHFPINRENVDTLAKWVASVSEQARHATEVNGPKIAAAFKAMVAKR